MFRFHTLNRLGGFWGGATMLLAVSLILFSGMVWAQNQIPQLGNTLVFPQFVNNGDYITIITLINTHTNLSINGQLYVYNQDGTLRPSPLAGQTGNPLWVTIPPGGTVSYSTPPGGGIPISGMAKFVSDLPAGGVVQFQFAGGQIGVMNAPFRSAATLVLNTANGNNTGLAIANASSSWPLNVSLAYVDENGVVQDTISPQELNPLPPNGQVARFVSDLPFHVSVANKSSGSIQIFANGAGQFNAFGLLFNNNLYSSTATVMGAYNHIDVEQYQGSYTGQWNNTIAQTSGTASAAVAINAHTQTVYCLLLLTGPVFGTTEPTTLTGFYGSYNQDGLTVTGDITSTGQTTLTIQRNGAFTLAANNLSSTVGTLNATGAIYPDKITATYTLGLRTGGTQTGTFNLNHTNQ